MKKIIAIMLIMIFSMFTMNLSANDAPQAHSEQTEKKEYQSKTLSELMVSFYETTGINALVNPSEDVMTSEPNPANARPMTNFEQTWGRIIMFIIVGILFYLANAIGNNNNGSKPFAIAR